MTLEKALLYAIDTEGIGILSEVRLKNYLNDLHAFDSPAVKRIVSTMVDDGYMSKLLASSSDENYELQFNDVSNRLVQVEGFQADLVSYIIDCLLYAFHKSNSVPTPPQKEVAKRKLSKSAVSGPEKNKLNVIQANGGFLIDFNGQSYELDGTQYKAIMRKKNMPADRLEIWLRSYVEENK